MQQVRVSIACKLESQIVPNFQYSVPQVINYKPCCIVLTGGMWFGVDVTREDIADNFEACVWEPVVVKVNAIIGATEAACLILSVDETIKSPKSNYQPPSGVPGNPRM